MTVLEDLFTIEFEVVYSTEPSMLRCFIGAAAEAARYRGLTVYILGSPGTTGSYTEHSNDFIVHSGCKEAALDGFMWLRRPWVRRSLRRG